MNNQWWLFPVLLSLWAAATSQAADNDSPPPNRGELIPENARLEELWNAGEFTEGVAVARDGAIYFSDIPGAGKKGRVLKYDPATGNTTVHCSDSRKSNGLMFDADGRLIAACGANGGARALCEITADGKVRPLAERFQEKRFNSPNDLIIHSSGDVYFSDPRYVGDEPRELEDMSVYRYDADDKRVHRLATGVTKPNGVELSPDESTLYVAETDNGSAPPAQAVTPRKMTLNAYAIQEDGTLGERRVLVDFGEQLGIDGLTVDSAGRIYAAVRSEDRYGIRVYQPDGKEVAYVPTPSLPTNCCFGVGTDRSALYITAGGGLYRIRTMAVGYHPFFGN